MENIKSKIKETKARKKGFLKAMPEDQRRLLKMEERANKTASRLLWCIPLLFVILVIAYIIISAKFSYENNWLINAAVAAALFLLGTIIILLIRSSYKKKANAYGSSITDYVQEYGEIKQHISDLKKADKDQRIAQKKAAYAEERAKCASERAAEQVRIAEEHAKAMQDNAKQASDHASSVVNSSPVSASLKPDAENFSNTDSAQGSELSSAEVSCEQIADSVPGDVKEEK